MWIGSCCGISWTKISKGVTSRLKKIYEETVAVVRTEEGISERFGVRKEVRQGCVLSPLLFNLYIADIDTYMRNRGIGGVKLGKERIWTLVYADDLMIVAKNREATVDMLDMLRRFLKDRRLGLNAKKTKVLVFHKKCREKIEKWKWNSESLEEVTKFKYLGFTFNRKGDYAEHIKELKLNGRIAANGVWGLGERICRDDFLRRRMLFDHLVRSVMSYGAEI